MTTSIRCLVVLLMVALARPPTTCGQSLPRPAWGVSASPSPRERRLIRERAVQRAGPEARAFVEAYGEDAVAAIYACTSVGNQKLIEFHASGGLESLPRPRDLLHAVARPKHGDDVILWAAANQAELADTDRFDAFVQEPLEYALGLKPLAEGVEELRAARRTPQPSQRPTIEFTNTPLPSSVEPRRVAVIAGAVAIVGLVIWWRRKRRQF